MPPIRANSLPEKRGKELVITYQVPTGGWIHSSVHSVIVYSSISTLLVNKDCVWAGCSVEDSHIFTILCVVKTHYTIPCVGVTHFYHIIPR